MSENNTPESLDLLLANIGHLHRTRAHQQFELLGLYRGQPPVLRALWQEEGLTQTELVDKMKIAPATLTKMLQRMEKAGFIRRHSDPKDQRVTRVFLTEAGRTIQSQVEQVFKKMEEEAFADFTLEERVLLRRFLLQIRDNLLQATGETPWK
jgi:DNA-binding MarR family transcriptional regulator